MNKRKIAIYTGNRAEYGLLHPIIRLLADDHDLEISLIISGTHLIEQYGETIEEIDQTGFANVKTIEIGEEAIRADHPRAKILYSYAAAMKQAVEVLTEIDPDILLIAGDRYETFAIAVTAYYMNVPIAHIFGGDLSQGGHLDDSVRHSITKLAHIHFTSNQDSYQRILKLGEEEWRVYNVGSPVVDSALSGEFMEAMDLAEEFKLDITKPIILFTQHPVTTEIDLAYEQVKQSLEALKELGHQTIITYPCNDAGGDDIVSAITEYKNELNFRIVKSLGWKRYLGFLKIAAVVVGNSSSGIIETPTFRIPCVNIGSRQKGRLRADNVIDVGYDKERIKTAIRYCLQDTEFKKKVQNIVNPYGEGGTSKRVVEILKEINLDKQLLQKKMSY